MKPTADQIEAVCGHISSLRPDEFNRVAIDFIVLADRLSLNYAQTRRVVRAACKEVGYVFRDGMVDVSQGTVDRQDGWAKKRGEIAKKLGLSG